MLVTVNIHPPLCNQRTGQKINLELKQDTISPDELIDILKEQNMFSNSYFNPEVDWQKQMVLLQEKYIANSGNLIFDNDTIHLFPPLQGG